MTPAAAGFELDSRRANIPLADLFGPGWDRPWIADNTWSIPAFPFTSSLCFLTPRIDSATEGMLPSRLSSDPTSPTDLPDTEDRIFMIWLRDRATLRSVRGSPARTATTGGKSESLTDGMSPSTSVRFSIRLASRIRARATTRSENLNE